MFLGPPAMWYLLLLSMGLTGFSSESSNTERLRVQITIPKKIRSMTTDGIESQVSYTIAIDGELYTVNLVQKNFLPRNFRVYSYNHSRSMRPLEQQLQNFCYYQGDIEGYPNSMVIISACTGLRGLLQFENVTYGIEPLEPSIGFEHVVYKVKHRNADISLYSEEGFQSRDPSYKVKSVQTYRSRSQYIEMHIVVEKNLYEQMGSDVSVVTQKIFQLIGLANAIFTSFNITIILSSLEFWIDGNKIPVTGDINEVLQRFLSWKKSYLVLRPHDVAFLLVYRENPDYIGAVFQGKMCDGEYNGGVALHPRILSLESFSVILAQLLSLSMGISYDNVDKCECLAAVCIMNPDAIYSTGVKNFSNCSMEGFIHFISNPSSHCLQNQPRLDPMYKSAVCGNGIKEDGEECDCEEDEDCISRECCDITTCKKMLNTDCSEGECCYACKYATIGKECRPRSDLSCDLPEYCNGTSNVCHPDHHVIDGHECGQGGMCINGSCIDGNTQCTTLIGYGSSYGSEKCFKAINALADEFGNCGKDNSEPKKCTDENIKCGKLICKYTEKKILKLKNAAVLYSNVDGDICVSVHYADTEDSTFVKDGTSCGDNKVCKNQECVTSTTARSDCSKSKCNDKGVCNELGNCHCDATYLPPDCKNSKSTSAGGSIDSGNYLPSGTPKPPVSVTGRQLSDDPIYHYRPKPARWPFFLLIPFLIILFVLIATLMRIYYQRKKWRTEEYSSDEQVDSENESEVKE